MRNLALLAFAGLLAACAQKQPPPDITYDSDDFGPAVEAPEPPRPVRVVAVPETLPLPGQLKPLPTSGDTPKAADDLLPEDRVADANEAAKMEPSSNGYINAIQVYPYAEGALYQRYTAPEKVSDIALQPGEKIVSVSAGDTVRWIIGDTASGEGASARAHILVKPIKEDLETNLVIITDRRAYHLELQSTYGTYMASVSWAYPHDELFAMRRRNQEAEEAEQRVVDRVLHLDNLKFRYEISGDTPPWRPRRAFDDGHKVYIQFPSKLGQGEAPPLFVVGAKGDTELVNYRVQGSYYVVDRLFAAAELRLGKAPQQVVRISRTDGKPATRGRHRSDTRLESGR